MCQPQIKIEPIRWDVMLWKVKGRHKEYVGGKKSLWISVYRQPNPIPIGPCPKQVNERLESLKLVV